MKAEYVTKTFRLDPEYAEKFEFVCRARNMKQVDVLRKFIDTQYELVNKDSELNQIMKSMESLASRLDEYNKKLEG